MKLMAFVGSPRKHSNTDLLIDKVIEGAKSKIEVEVEKIYLYDADIKYCTACGKHTILEGRKPCPIKDDMEGILQRMEKADGFIFGSPNHGRTISAPMTNFIARMMPLLNMQVVYGEKGEIKDAWVESKVKGKKVVSVISQGDPWPSSSALVMKILDDNFKDFQMKKVGEVFSMSNLRLGQVKDKKADLDVAFFMGARLASV
jgi:multimeric flavodoxin WrbA